MLGDLAGLLDVFSSVCAPPVEKKSSEAFLDKEGLEEVVDRSEPTLDPEADAIDEVWSSELRLCITVKAAALSAVVIALRGREGCGKGDK